MTSLPSKTRMCHRCGFEKSCRDLVVSEACDRWKKIPWNTHPMTGEKHEDYACVDDHIFAQLLDLQRQIGCTTLEMNQMRNEFKESHQANVAIGAAAVQRARAAVDETMKDSIAPLVRALGAAMTSRAPDMTALPPTPAQKLLNGG